MRMVIAAAALVVLVATGRTAHACKHAGKVLLKVTQSPMTGSEDSVPDAQLVIYASGAWGWVQEMPAGEEPASWGGCLSKKRLAALKKAVRRARFVKGPEPTCEEVPTTKVEYAAPGRKKSVWYTLPICGNSLDDETQAMIALVQDLTRR